MQWIVYLFSLYIIMLSGIPCQDTDTCCAERAETETKDNPTKQDSNHNIPRSCSPFFVCGTCHLTTIPNVQIDLTGVFRPIMKILHHFHNEESLPDFHYAIWQPPKVA